MLSLIFIVLQSAGRHTVPLGHIILIPSKTSLCSYSLMYRKRNSAMEACLAS